MNRLREPDLFVYFKDIVSALFHNVLKNRTMPEETKDGCCCPGEESEGCSVPEKRLGWHEYFMSVAHLISRRATCTRGHIGAVIVRENSILSTGYNGAPSGLPHCNDCNCRIYRSIHPDGTVEENCVNTIHAEINAIAQAAKHGVSIKDSDIYITASPCIHCLKVLINVGIKTIYYDKPYKIEHIDELLRLSGIRLVQVNLPGHHKE
jgi:dCMP deaminase